MEIRELYKKLNNRQISILGSERFSKYAVLLPLLVKKDELHILFEVRSHSLRRQPGEICFPGGRIDKEDRDEQHTAIRETSEELGLVEYSLHDIAPLDYMVTPFGTIIYPFVGTISDPLQISPNPAEVEEVFTVPISFLKRVKPEIYKIHYRLEPEQGFPFDKIIGGEKYNWQPRVMDEYFYFYEDKAIWGLTARILHHFLEVIGN
jgi:8-oxo-dGTP pyrophosphatase MutT (NUDIX family)